MALVATPVFAQAPKTFYAAATTAFALTGSGSALDDNPSNTVLLVTADADGTMVTDISIIPRATAVACIAGLFLSKDGGTTKKLISTVAIAGQTLANGQTAAVVEYKFTVATESLPLRLEGTNGGNTDKLYVGLSVTHTNGINFVARAVDY